MKIEEAKTLDEILSLLQKLFYNMSNLDRVYYDMFINTIPMDITLERYNEAGVLETFVIPNRAKDKANLIQGSGNPNGQQTGVIGMLYIDVNTNNIYVKTDESSKSGWVVIYTGKNFISGINYLSPDGSGAGLKDLSFSNITGGVLSPEMGGTGIDRDHVNVIKGVLKSNGYDKDKGITSFAAAVDGKDFVSPDSHIGMLGLFSYDLFTREGAEEIYSPWLLANGAELSRLLYPKLFKAIGTTYNKETTPADKFRLPDYRGYFLSCWDDRTNRKLNEPQAGGVPNIKGHIPGTTGLKTGGGSLNPEAVTGAFKVFSTNAAAGENNTTISQNSIFEFDASQYNRDNNVYRDDINDVLVKNMAVVVCIYAGVE